MAKHNNTIEFLHKLPAMHIDGKDNGTYNNYEMVLPAILTTKDHELGDFLHILYNNIRDDRRLIWVDGKVLKASNNWIRDHVHEMKGTKHWEYDLKSFLDFVLENQQPTGRYLELIKQMDDVHWSYVDETCVKFFPEDNLAMVRLELEADIEYLVVEGAMQVYAATGDAAWLLRALPKLEKGIDYCTSDAKRWAKEYGLVMRPFTIDTWDFTKGDRGYDPGTDRRIHDDEPMCIMHGDNSGVYQAMLLLAKIRDMAHCPEQAAIWRKRAQALKENMFRWLWNGRFFLHQLHIGVQGDPYGERERLSLSNAYDMTRGVTNLAQSRSIIEEYMRRRETTTAFAEWFSIDPPYDKFGAYKPGQYVNGGISPFTAGELARAAFQNGYEAYGWDILTRCAAIAKRDKTVYFLYAPENSEELLGGPSAWGCAALMAAVDEGLAGIVDEDCLYRKMALSPRFPVTPYKELRYLTGYEVSGTYVDLRYILTEEGMRYDLYSPSLSVSCHFLLPKGKNCCRALCNGEEVEFAQGMVGESAYVDFSVQGQKHLQFEMIFA